MKYHEPQKIVVTIEVVRQPGMFLAKAKSDSTGAVAEGTANSSNESEKDLAFVMGNAVCNLLMDAAGRYHKMHDVATFMDLKPEAQKEYEQLTLVFAR